MVSNGNTIEGEHTHADQASIPAWLSAPFVVCRRRLHDEVRFIHLVLRGLDRLIALPELLEVLLPLHNSAEEANPDDVEMVNRAKTDAKWVEKEASTGFPILHSHSVVSVWGILEVLVEDYAV